MNGRQWERQRLNLICNSLFNCLIEHADAQPCWTARDNGERSPNEQATQKMRRIGSCKRSKRIEEQKDWRARDWRAKGLKSKRLKSKGDGRRCARCEKVCGVLLIERDASMQGLEGTQMNPMELAKEPNPVQLIVASLGIHKNGMRRNAMIETFASTGEADECLLLKLSMFSIRSSPSEGLSLKFFI